MSCESLFTEQLHQRRFRLTPQREMVLVELHQLGRPATAEEIYARVAQKSASVELSTVYRTLDLLNSMNLVTMIDCGDKQRQYELVGNIAPHIHLVCKNCGKITGVDLDLLQPFLSHLKEKVHFVADLGNFTISGLCEGCLE